MPSTEVARAPISVARDPAANNRCKFWQWGLYAEDQRIGKGGLIRFGTNLTQKDGQAVGVDH